MNTVPLVDLAWQDHAIATTVAAGWADVIATGAFTNGPDVAAFESEYAAFLGVAHCIGVSNGTDAIELILRAQGIGSGDEVLLPANTFFATAEAVVRAGATPVACDVDAQTLQLDVNDAAARVTSRTAAIVPVHLHGHPAPMDAVMMLAEWAGIFVLEDAAQSQGARLHGRLVGAWGDAAATSFYPGKNLGAYGDAGAVMTNDQQHADRVRQLRDHGSVEKYRHDAFGCTARLDTLQAVVLRAKLPFLNAWNERRVEAARIYDELLDGLPGVERPGVAPGAEPVWHCYVVRVPERDAVLAGLHRAGIGAGIHYPVPVHHTPAWMNAGYETPELPVAERAADEILTLPMFPGITRAQQERVVEALALALRRAA